MLRNVSNNLCLTKGMNNLLVAGDALDDCLEEAEKPKDSTEDYSANRFQKNVSGKVIYPKCYKN